MTETGTLAPSRGGLAKRPAVTVIVPVYKGGARADVVIRSLIAQTYRPLRILVINDGSPLPEDADIGRRFDGLIDFVQQPNAGLCATWNRAVDMTETPLIARLDQDDEAVPDRIEAQVKLLMESNSDVCVSTILTDNDRAMATHPVGLEVPTRYDPNVHGTIVLSTLLARTDFVRQLGGNDPALYPCDDFDWMIRAWRSGRVIIHPRALVRYLLHDSANTFKYFWEMELKSKYLVQDRCFPVRRQTYGEWRSSDEGKSGLNPREKIRALGKLYYRRAGIRIGLRKYVSGAALLLVSALLYPTFFFDRIGASTRVLRRAGSSSP